MKIFDFLPEGTQGCYVKAYLQTAWTKEEMEKMPALPAVLICPGGGYETVASRAAEPVAKEYLAANYHAFVLSYSVGDKAKDFQPLIQLASTMVHIRAHAVEWHIDPNRIAVWGSSAGGHLAASLGTLHNDRKFLDVWNKKAQTLFSIRPNAMVLGYPVITADEFAHKRSIERVSGAVEGEEKYYYFGLDKHVDEQTPQTFLCHTVADSCVPVENSLRFGAALAAAKVPFEMHILPDGDHGMSVCTMEVGTADSYNRRWVEWSIQWLNRVLEFQT